MIGSGAAGLVAARVLARRERAAAVDITVLEKDRDVAGVWNYHPSSTTRPMYRSLRTNLPKEIMAYREFPWPAADRSFVTHADVSDYLHQYCDNFGLETFIRRGCRVDQLSCLPDTKSCLSPASEAWPQIRLDWRDANDILCSEIFDAVCVCNGHYNAPATPNIPGLTEYFRGETLHSIAYDVPEAFAGRTVLCIGGRASGSDLARELAEADIAAKVYLSDSAFAAHQPVTHHNLTWLPKTTEILADGSVAFAPTAVGEVAPPIHVDTIIFCSGYDYHFPFINDKSNLKLMATNRRVQPLFEQLWHAECPNIAFVGLPHSIIPFPCFELQAEAVDRSWRESILPEVVGRRAAAAADAESGGLTNGRVPEDTHNLGPAQWEYCRRMAGYAGILDDRLNDYLATNQVGDTSWFRIF